MRISDWSSDVCSSDLHGRHGSTVTSLPKFGNASGPPLCPCLPGRHSPPIRSGAISTSRSGSAAVDQRSEEHTSELQSLMRISYAVFCLKKKNLNCLQTQPRLS